MSKINAGERKRTVTIVLGPKTELALLQWGKDMEEQFEGSVWTLTDLLGVMLRKEMRERIDLGLIELPKEWVRMSE
jgi:hypothetical protein